ncbi:uncharacterized protein LOC115969170 [Quercus lobata]|uniref:Uncharacterized protein n=1 Tax=Quercus lobata TaxID=97700 RepID=A0A7N2MYW2_QUELO|nr:uncharacterized protein LOC115969170 [Quercus lobata]
MDVEEGAMESSILSSILNSIESNERGEGLSPEDIAWVDSCLIKDPESSETNMNSLKDALLEIFISQPELINSSAAVSNGSPEETDVEILPSSEEADTVQFQGRTDDDLVLINKETKTKGDDLPINLKNNTLPSLTYGGNSFLLTHTEGLEESGSSGSKLDLGSPTYELEPSNVDDMFLANEEEKTKGDDLPIKLGNNTLQSFTYGGNSFLLTHSEGLKESGSSASKLDLGSLTNELEPSNVDDMVLSNEEEKTKGDNLPIKLKNNTLQSSTFERNPFLPTYTEGLKESGRTESMLDLGSSAYDVEPSTEDIFRVWDLDIPAEDGELVKQLNKALTDNSFESIPSTLNDSGAWKDLEEQSVDNLIAGISDLSLYGNSS